MTNDATTDQQAGETWTMLLGDACERLAELADDSIDLSIYSPPFRDLYVYSPSPRDIGNCRSTDEFIDHYGYVIREVLRVTKPGRNSCVHVADIGTTKATHGVQGVFDLAGAVIRAHEAAGWVFYGRVTVDKNPQAAAVRTKAHRLMFATKNKDSARSAPALPDYLLLFKKPGDNLVPVATDVTNDEWIQWARPVWLDIIESNTLNVRTAREDADEKHLCPLQLDFIDRCVRLWSNKGETVLSPFAGIGSEGHGAVRRGRRFIGIELKGSYWQTACANLTRAEYDAAAPLLFDLAAESA